MPSKSLKVNGAIIDRDELMNQNKNDSLPDDLPDLPSRRRSIAYESKKPSAAEALKLQLWKYFRKFRRDDVRFAIKVGIGAALFASASFIPILRPIYQHWRGEWGLLSYMLVCSMTIGA